MPFLPEVQKVINEAIKKPTIEKRLDYFFKALGEGKVCIKPASELTIKEMMHWAIFFGLDMKLQLQNKKVTVKRRKPENNLHEKTTGQSIIKRRK